MRPRVLYAHHTRSSFVEIDRALLDERYVVRDWHQPRRLGNPFAIAAAVLRSDLVVGWWAHWQTFLPITFAWLFRKPSVLIVGGFDTASMPDIGYGHQQGGLRRMASRWVMKRARRLITNSRYSLSEIERNTPIPPERVTVVHHGLPDPFGELPEGERERAALTVGTVDRSTLDQKGHRAFVEAAAHLPDVRFVFAGAWGDDTIDELRELATPNVEFTGRLSDDELHERYRRASVYVQASRHEGFGLAVAEAMLAGCVPVVVDATAMPEVVGDAGVLIPSGRPGDVADGVRRALAAGSEARRRARERIVSEFPLERRREGLMRVTEEALGRL